MKRAVLSVTAVAALVALTSACSAPGQDTADAKGEVQEAQELSRVTSAHAETGGTLLEGPTIGEDGKLYLVDVMAPAGEPKVLRIDTADADAEPETVYTDEASAFTSAQFHPVNGRLYLTDIATGSIRSIASDGQDPQEVFTGEIGGAGMMPDDLSFDEDGNMFVTDTTGMKGPGWDTPGRVLCIGADGTASVLAEDLPSPNGIAFDEDGAGLYVAQYNANRIDYYALDDDGTSVVAAYPAIHVDAGRARIDSTAVDSDGNIYQAFHGKPEIAVYSPDGQLRQTISVPGEGLDSATNIAIAPGTTKGYLTVSGPAGGYVYTFDALAAGTRSSNGG